MKLPTHTRTAARNLPAILETLQEPLLVLDHEFRVLDANPAFYRIFKTTQRHTLGRLLFRLGNSQWNVPALRLLLDGLLPQRQRIEEFRVEHAFPRIGRKVFRLNGRQIFDAGVATQTILLTLLDVTDVEAVAGRMIDAREEEGLRIAQALHDLSSAGLTSIGWELAQLADRIWPGEEERRLRAMQGRLNQLSSDTHDLAQRIHPTVVHDLGLRTALQAECDALLQGRAIRADLRPSGQIDTLPGTISLPVYRVVQEALFNVRRHSRARQVTVSLEVDARELRLTVRDDGRGFKPGAARSRRGLGLKDMSDRVSALGGRLTAESAPRKGTTISATIPLPWAAVAPVVAPLQRGTSRRRAVRAKVPV